MDLVAINSVFRLVVWVIFVASLVTSVGVGIIISNEWTRFSNERGIGMLTLIVYGTGCLVALLMLLAGAYTFFI